jgi:hypothetical protein
MRLLLLCVLLAGCSPAPEQRQPSQVRSSQAAEEAVARTPIPRTYQIDGNQLQVIEVPVRIGSRFVEHQRCFVWRDAEFKTTSLQCPSDTGRVDLAPPERDDALR